MWGRIMTCEQYYDLNASEFSDFMDDLFWRDERGNTEIPFQAMCQWATEEGVLLSDMPTWNYDEFFKGCWACGEWGLS